MLRVACYCLGVATMLHTGDALVDSSSQYVPAVTVDPEEELPRFHTFPHAIIAEKDHFGHDAAPAEGHFTRIPAHAFEGKISI